MQYARRYLRFFINCLYESIGKSKYSGYCHFTECHEKISDIVVLTGISHYKEDLSHF